MPCKVKKVHGGYKVFSPSGSKSNRPISKEKARKQQAAIYANTKGESLERRLDRALLEMFPDTGEGGPHGDGNEPAAEGFGEEDVRVVSAHFELNHDRWDDPGDYPSSAGGSQLPSYNYIEDIEGGVELELGQGALDHITRRQSEGEDLNEIARDMGLEEIAAEEAKSELGNSVKIASWDTTLKGTRLILQPADFDASNYSHERDDWDDHDYD